MKTIRISLIIMIFACINLQAQINHTFTYQGELVDADSPAQGTYDIIIAAYADADATGPMLSSSTHTAVSVNTGVFTLNKVDLGNNLFNGLNIWLQIRVKKPADANYTALVPLQKMHSVPYANSLIDNGATDGQVLTFNTINGWQPSTPASGTDDQNISGSGLNGTNLTIGIESGTSQTINLASLQDGGATTLDELVDAKSDSDGSDNGSSVFIGSGAGIVDDGSNNKNVGVGFQSLFSNTTGSNNTANGYKSLYSNTTGNNNNANGVQSLYFNTTGNDNTANGFRSLYRNTTGYNNTANGFQSLYSNTTGANNTANGVESLVSNTTGSLNTANGFQSLYSNTTGNRNTANGYRSLYSNTTGYSNTANGYFSLYFNTIGFSNTANGYYSLYFNTTGNENTANGYRSLFSNTTGNTNTANGYQSLYSNTIGVSNMANGFQSLYSNISGNFNTANGMNSLYSNTTGNFNTANGRNSLYSNTTGINNTAIGHTAFSSGSAYSNSTALGYNAQPGASNTVRIGNSSVATIGGYADWTTVSDARFKTNIKEDVPGLEFIKKLRPVTYQLDMDAIAAFHKTPDTMRLSTSENLKAAEIQTGFLAQEVEAAALSLGYDFHGVDKPKNQSSHYGLRYAEFVVPLVKAVQELAGSNNKSSTQVQNNAATSQLQQQIETLKSENQQQKIAIQQLNDRFEDLEKLLLTKLKNRKDAEESN